MIRQTKQVNSLCIQLKDSTDPFLQAVKHFLGLRSEKVIMCPWILIIHCKTNYFRPQYTSTAHTVSTELRKVVIFTLICTLISLEGKNIRTTLLCTFFTEFENPTLSSATLQQRKVRDFQTPKKIVHRRLVLIFHFSNNRIVFNNRTRMTKF